ncbi:MAG: DUF4160 domain-containing protein [Candidatus Dormibacteraceae bacterium]
MPRISAFYGIIVRMYHDDHAPPHVHVQYSEKWAKISIGEVKVIDGSLPPRVIRLYREWAGLHQNELLENWRRARRSLPLEPISPLE